MIRWTRPQSSKTLKMTKIKVLLCDSGKIDSVCFSNMYSTNADMPFIADASLTCEDKQTLCLALSVFSS
jgi:hypothetical protein